MNKKGFTLIEVMVVIAIISILSGVATPNLISFLESAKFNGTVFTFRSQCKKAQMQAIKRNKNVALTVINNQYMFFTDVNGNFVYDPGTDEDFNETDLQYGIEIETFITAGTIDTVAFNSRGMCVVNTGTFASPLAEIVFKKNNKWYKVDFTITGLVHVTRSTDGITFTK